MYYAGPCITSCCGRALTLYTILLLYRWNADYDIAHLEKRFSYYMHFKAAVQKCGNLCKCVPWPSSALQLRICPLGFCFIYSNLHSIDFTLPPLVFISPENSALSHMALLRHCGGALNFKMDLTLDSLQAAFMDEVKCKRRCCSLMCQFDRSPTALTPTCREGADRHVVWRVSCYDAHVFFYLIHNTLYMMSIILVFFLNHL